MGESPFEKADSAPGSFDKKSMGGQQFLAVLTHGENRVCKKGGNEVLQTAKAGKE
jgi:hypothetical protein